MKETSEKGGAGRSQITGLALEPHKRANHRGSVVWPFYTTRLIGSPYKTCDLRGYIYTMDCSKW